MAKRWINLSGEELERWDNTPILERKTAINRALLYYHNTEISETEKAHAKMDVLMEKRKLLDEIGGFVEDLEGELEIELYKAELELDKLEGPDRGLHIIDDQQFWDIFLESAQRHLDEDICFDSPTVKGAYRIKDIVDGKNGKKVLVERIFSKSSKPSTFTKATVEKALSRLRQAGSTWIPVGNFMPVLAQECVMVEIHPQLEVVDISDEGGEWGPPISGSMIVYTEVEHLDL